VGFNGFGLKDEFISEQKAYEFLEAQLTNRKRFNKAG